MLIGLKDALKESYIHLNAFRSRSCPKCWVPKHLILALEGFMLSCVLHSKDIRSRATCYYGELKST